MQPPPQKNTSRKKRRRKCYDERFGANPYITTSSLPSCNERYATNNPSGARRHFRFRPRGNEARKKSPPRRHRPQPTTKPRADRPSSGSHARATSIQHAAFFPLPLGSFPSLPACTCTPVRQRARTQPDVRRGHAVINSPFPSSGVVHLGYPLSQYLGAIQGTRGVSLLLALSFFSLVRRPIPGPGGRRLCYSICCVMVASLDHPFANRRRATV